MPQVSEHPPPYSKKPTLFPPPLQVDTDLRVWAFQRAFEGAREIVRVSVMDTFTIWDADWFLKGQRVARNDVQRAYHQAPEDLRSAIDWQLAWDSPAFIPTDQVRRCLEYDRKRQAGTLQEILPLEQFLKEFDAASPQVQRATVMTFTAWRRYNDSVKVEPPRRSELMGAYEAASRPLKAALCFVLEMGLTAWVQRAQNIESSNAITEEIIEWQQSEVRRWEQEGRARGLW